MAPLVAFAPQLGSTVLGWLPCTKERYCIETLLGHYNMALNKMHKSNNNRNNNFAGNHELNLPKDNEHNMIEAQTS